MNMFRLKTLAKCLCQSQIKKYLEMLSEMENCIIISAVKDQISLYYDNELSEKMKQLGFSINLVQQYWKGYIGIVDDNKIIFERLSDADGEVSYIGEIDNIQLKVRSASYWNENLAEILLNGIDYAVNGRGINIVIYDKKLKQVIDSICFDTHIKELPLIHKNIILPSQLYWHVSKQYIHNKIYNQVGPFQRENIQKENKIKTSSTVIEKSREYRQRLSPIKLFPQIFSHIVKVRLITAESSYAWYTVKSLLMSFIADMRFQISIVFLNDISFQQSKDFAKELGIICFRWNEYNIEQDQPDIVIATLSNTLHPRFRDVYWLCGNFSKMFFVLPYTLTGHYDECFASRIASVAVRLQKFGLDYCFWDSLIYKKLKSDGYDISHCVEMGNPKFDIIYSKLNKHNFLPESWEKIKEKTVFLWATDHEWMSNNCTFDQYAQTIFHYFYNLSNVALIFRPHPYYINELKTANIWTQQEIEQLKSYFNESPNMIWDEDPDYSLAYDMADAIITDVECGITVSALATKKPLCVFFRMGVPKHIEFPELIDNLYQVQSEQECIEFFEMIQRGEDPMKEQREQAFHNCICHFDGKNGQRMKDFIAEKYFEKYGAPENQE